MLSFLLPSSALHLAMNSKISARTVYQERLQNQEKRRGSSPVTCNSSSNHKWIARRAGDVPPTLGRQGVESPPLGTLLQETR